jgi:manganese efflux pump family protein
MVEYLTLFLLALSLSMDTLAVSVTIGICKEGLRPRHAMKAASFFAFFQTLMPAAGYLAGIKLITLIQPFDHWVAFALLAFIGGKMIYETLHETAVVDSDDAPSCPREDPTSSRRLALLAMATSIDALAAGISLAVGRTPVAAAFLIIALVTFFVSLTGTLLGKRLGAVFNRRACLAGGAMLILLGIKIVVEHTLVA